VPGKPGAASAARYLCFILWVKWSGEMFELRPRSPDRRANSDAALLPALYGIGEGCALTPFREETARFFCEPSRTRSFLGHVLPAPIACLNCLPWLRLTISPWLACRFACSVRPGYIMLREGAGPKATLMRSS
jgi:hypothetical protein